MAVSTIRQERVARLSPLLQTACNNAIVSIWDQVYALSLGLMCPPTRCNAGGCGLATNHPKGEGLGLHMHQPLLLEDGGDSAADSLNQAAMSFTGASRLLPS
jgi:hypothetical protein